MPTFSVELRPISLKINQAHITSKSPNHLTHAPEFDLKEQVWQFIKKGLRWKLPVNLEELRYHLKQRLEPIFRRSRMEVMIF